MTYRSEKITFFILWNSGSISLIIWGEHGIHCMPCSSPNMRWYHRSVTITTLELPTVVLSILTEWHPNDITLISIWHHSCYGNRSMISIPVGAWLTVYARPVFNDFTNWNSFNRNFRFSQTNNFSQVIKFCVLCENGRKKHRPVSIYLNGLTMDKLISTNGFILTRTWSCHTFIRGLSSKKWLGLLGQGLGTACITVM